MTLSIAARMDIGHWYREVYPWCPNCHADFRKFHPAMNLQPHWTGECKERWQETGIERHWREQEQGL